MRRIKEIFLNTSGQLPALMFPSGIIKRGLPRKCIASEYPATWLAGWFIGPTPVFKLSF